MEFPMIFYDNYSRSVLSMIVHIFYIVEKPYSQTKLSKFIPKLMLFLDYLWNFYHIRTLSRLEGQMNRYQRLVTNELGLSVEAS